MPETENSEMAEKLVNRNFNIQNISSMSTFENDTGLNITDQFSMESFESLKIGISERAQIFLSQPDVIIGLILSTVTIVINAVSLMSISCIKGTISNHLRLIISLSIADMLVSFGFVCHILHSVFTPGVVHRFIESDPQKRLLTACSYAFILSLHATANLISVLNLMVMAADHYLAIMKPLHHLTNVNTRMCQIIIIAIWFLSCFGGYSNFVFGVTIEPDIKQNYCELVISKSKYQVEYIVWVVAMISIVVITYSYLRIFFKVRQVNFHIQHVNHNYARNRKAMITTLIIIGTFIVCWMPTCLFQTTVTIQTHVNPSVVLKNYMTLKYVNKYLNLLLLLNSLFNPIIYAIRLKEVQYGYRYLLVFCRSCHCCKQMFQRIPSFTENTNCNYNNEQANYSSVYQWRVTQKHNTQSDSSESDACRHVSRQYQAPLRVTFSKEKSSKYTYGQPNDPDIHSSIMKCSVKIFENKLRAQPRRLTEMLYRHSPERFMRIRLMPNNELDLMVLTSFLSSRNTFNNNNETVEEQRESSVCLNSKEFINTIENQVLTMHMKDCNIQTKDIRVIFPDMVMPTASNVRETTV